MVCFWEHGAFYIIFLTENSVRTQSLEKSTRFVGAFLDFCPFYTSQRSVRCLRLRFFLTALRYQDSGRTGNAEDEAAQSCERQRAAAKR